MQTNLGKLLREYRQARKLTVRDVADIAGVSYSLISKIENNKRTISSPLFYRLQHKVFHLDEKEFRRLLQIKGGLQAEEVIMPDKIGKGGVKITWKRRKNPEFKLIYRVM